MPVRTLHSRLRRLVIPGAADISGPVPDIFGFWFLVTQAAVRRGDAGEGGGSAPPPAWASRQRLRLRCRMCLAPPPAWASLAPCTRPRVRTGGSTQQRVVFRTLCYGGPHHLAQVYAGMGLRCVVTYQGQGQPLRLTRSTQPIRSTGLLAGALPAAA